MAGTGVIPFAVAILLALGSSALAQSDLSVQARTLSLNIPVDPASRLVSVTVRPGRATNAGLTDDLRFARTAMLEGQDISPVQLRALADLDDGLAAQKYVRYLLAQMPGASASDIAYYASVAVRTGRVWTLPDAVAAMRLLDPATEPPERIRAYVEMLYPHAWAGNSIALDAVIDLNGEGRLFGALSDATRAKILEADAAFGGGRATMRMALAILSQDRMSDTDRALARDYLTRSAAHDNLSVSVTATNLLALMEGGAAPVLSQ